MSYFFRVYHCCFFYCTFHLLHLASTFFRVCLCMCASAKVIYCYKYLLVSFLSTFSLRFLWRTLVFFRFRFCISPCCLLFCTFFFATFALAFISSLLSSSSAPSNCLLYELRPAFERHPPTHSPFTLFACFCCILFSVILLNITLMSTRVLFVFSFTHFYYPPLCAVYFRLLLLHGNKC